MTKKLVRREMADEPPAYLELCLDMSRRGIIFIVLFTTIWSCPVSGGDRNGGACSLGSCLSPERESLDTMSKRQLMAAMSKRELFNQARRVGVSNSDAEQFLDDEMTEEQFIDLILKEMLNPRHDLPAMSKKELRIVPEETSECLTPLTRKMRSVPLASGLQLVPFETSLETNWPVYRQNDALEPGRRCDIRKMLAARCPKLASLPTLGNGRFDCMLLRMCNPSNVL